jgi:hypothetical protein
LSAPLTKTLDVTEFMKKQYDYAISVNPVIPPVGSVYRFAATISYFYAVGTGKDQSVDTKLGESLGRTEAEAESKLRKRVEAWIREKG